MLLSLSRLNSEPKPKQPLSQSSAAVWQVLSHFRAHRRGRQLGEWTKHTLCLENYRELCQSLADDPELEAYVEAKVRYDYVPHASELVIRTPSALHVHFTHLVVREIQRQIDVAIVEFSKSTSSSPLAQFLQNVICTTTSDVVAQDNAHHKRSPDASFRSKGARFPSLIIETAYSQRAKSLRRVAEDWLLMSAGNVKMVIGLEIGYRAKKTLKVTDKVLVWEPKWKTEEVPVLTSECTFNKPFRNLDGHPPMAGGEALIIPLCALAPQAMLNNYGIVNNQYSLPAASIPMTTLASFLDEAQGDFEFLQIEDSPPPQAVMRRRSSSSEEDLLEADIRREERREKKTELKSEREDEDWEP